MKYNKSPALTLDRLPRGLSHSPNPRTIITNAKSARHRPPSLEKANSLGWPVTG
ncbi:MAG: hypothetical protein ACK5LK_06145 [Chthoniobacterales bacterium]